MRRTTFLLGLAVILILGSAISQAQNLGIEFPKASIESARIDAGRVVIVQALENFRPADEVSELLECGGIVVANSADFTDNDGNGRMEILISKNRINGKCAGRITTESETASALNEFGIDVSDSRVTLRRAETTSIASYSKTSAGTPVLSKYFSGEFSPLIIAHITKRNAAPMQNQNVDVLITYPDGRVLLLPQKTNEDGKIMISIPLSDRSPPTKESLLAEGTYTIIVNGASILIEVVPKIMLSYGFEDGTSLELQGDIDALATKKDFGFVEAQITTEAGGRVIIRTKENKDIAVEINPETPQTFAVRAEAGEMAKLKFFGLGGAAEIRYVGNSGTAEKINARPGSRLSFAADGSKADVWNKINFLDTERLTGAVAMQTAGQLNEKINILILAAIAGVLAIALLGIRK